MDQLDEIKQKTDIVAFISEYLPLKKAGRNFRALCPFHTEKSPSFMISPERQIWHCFGCQRGGDAFSFLMQMENLEFPEALEILAKRAGVKLLTGYQASDQAKLREKILKINYLAGEFYHYLLTSHRSGKRALDYVLNRGVNKKSIETFSLGWAPNLWDSLIRFLAKKGYGFSDLEKTGLVVKSERSSSGRSSFYDRFRGRLMFSLRDHRGNVIGFAGRTLDPQAKEAKYINTPETAVYIKGNVLYGLDVTKEAIKKEDKAIVVEGELDLISSFQAGVSNIVAIKGTALTEGQVSLLKRFTQNMVLSLDTDLAGDAAARRGIELAEAAGFSIRIIKLPCGKDPDECVRTNSGLWKKAVSEAVPVFDFVLDSAISRYDKKTAEGKAKIGNEVLPVLMRITNPIIQSHYLQKLASLLGVSEEVIVQTAKKIVKEEKIGVSSSPKTSSPKLSRQQLLEEQLLSLLVQSEEPSVILTNEEVKLLAEFLTVTAIKKIFKLLNDYLLSAREFNIEEFGKTVPSELVPTLDRAYLMDLSSVLKDPNLFNRELERTTMEIKRTFLKQQLLSLAGQLEQETKEEGGIDRLKEEYARTARELKKYQ